MDNGVCLKLNHLPQEYGPVCCAAGSFEMAALRTCSSPVIVPYATTVGPLLTQPAHWALLTTKASLM